MASAQPLFLCCLPGAFLFTYLHPGGDLQLALGWGERSLSWQPWHVCLLRVVVFIAVASPRSPAPNPSPCSLCFGKLSRLLLEALGAVVMWRLPQWGCLASARGRGPQGGDAAVPPSISWRGAGAVERDGGLWCVAVISLLLSPGRGAVLGQMVFMSDLVSLSDSPGC